MGCRPQALVIPAAGLGTRVRSVNPHLPKEMLPIGVKPAIQYAVEEGLDAGIEQIIVIISPAKAIIREHLEGLGYPVTFLYQREPRGEMDAVALAEDRLAGEALALIYPDNVYLPAPGALRRLVAVFDQRGEDVQGLTRVTPAQAPFLGNAGTVEVRRLAPELYRIESFRPKAPGHFQLRFAGELRCCGLMVCGPHLFEVIRWARATLGSGELTDEPVRKRMLEGRSWLGVALPGTVHDIGNPDGYLHCAKLVGQGRFESPQAG